MKQLDFNAVLRDFQYKPNVRFGAYERDGKWWIRIIMYVENAREPWRPWELKSMPQDDTYYYDSFMRLPPRSHGVGYSPSREMIELTGNYVIPPAFFEGDEENFVSWMVYTIKGMEDHESDEWLRYKGELLNDPHKE
jgi:hypothetical protein